MRPKEIYEMISVAVEHPDEVPPVFIEGSPGIGKSAVPREVCEEKELDFVDIRLVQRDPGEFRVPVPNRRLDFGKVSELVGKEVPIKDVSRYGEDAVLVKFQGKELFFPADACEKKLTEWFTSDELPQDPNGRGIIALDELTSAPPLVQAMAYQLTFDRQLAEYHVPKGYYVMAMGNLLKDRAVVHPMSTALNNRFFHIPFDVDAEQWIEWAMVYGLDPTIIAFIKWRSELLWKFDPESSEKAFPSPRTWDFSDTLIKYMPKDLFLEILTGTVGRGAASEFMSFLKVQNELPDPQKIFNGEDFWPDRMDLRYALVSVLASRAKPQHYERLLEYSKKMQAEFSVLMVSMLAHKDEKAFVTAPNFKDWVKKHSDVIVARKYLNK